MTTSQSIYQSYLAWQHANPEQSNSYRALFLTHCGNYYEERNPKNSYLRDGVVLNEAEKIMNRSIWRDFPEALERLHPFATRYIEQLHQTDFLFFPTRLDTYIERLVEANCRFLDELNAEYHGLEQRQQLPQHECYLGA